MRIFRLGLRIAAIAAIAVQIFYRGPHMAAVDIITGLLILGIGIDIVVQVIKGLRDRNKDNRIE